MLYNNKDNVVKVQGIVSQIDLSNRLYTNADGSQFDAINGTYTVLVEQDVNGEHTEIEVPVRVFAKKYKNDGQPNPAYLAAQTAMNDWTSIAMSNKDSATRVQVNGSLMMNEYPNRQGVIVSYPGVTASFPRVITKNECQPEATFKVKMYIKEIVNEVDAEGVETGRVKVVGLIPQFGEKVMIVPFYASNPGTINQLMSHWSVDDTVNAMGRLNFTVSTVTSSTEVAFGEAETHTFTRTHSELIITGGSQPAEGDMAFDPTELKAGLQLRQAGLDRMKERKQNLGLTADINANGYGKTGAAPSTTSSSKFKDLGF